jgi:hypothetical protein
VAANYRAAGRSRSKVEFLAKIGVVVEEADETVFWLEMLADSGIVQSKKLENMLDEANLAGQAGLKTGHCQITRSRAITRFSQTALPGSYSAA